MASVALYELWVHAGDDLADYVTSDGFLAESSSTSSRAEIRTYAGGVERLVTRPGTPRTLDVSMPQVARDVIAWLEDHAGQVVMVRDPRGRLVWGMYSRVAVSEEAGPVLPDVSFTLRSVTYSEAV